MYSLNEEDVLRASRIFERTHIFLQPSHARRPTWDLVVHCAHLREDLTMKDRV